MPGERVWVPTSNIGGLDKISFIAFTGLDVYWSKNGSKLCAGLYKRSEKKGGVGHLAFPFRFEGKTAREGYC